MRAVHSAGRAYDRYLEAGLKPAEDLNEADALFILQNFFHAQRQRMIDVHPRYAELLARRGYTGSENELRTAARRFAWWVPCGSCSVGPAISASCNPKLIVESAL